MRELKVSLSHGFIAWGVRYMVTSQFATVNKGDNMDEFGKLEKEWGKRQKC